jgi:hypothetical protein
MRVTVHSDDEQLKTASHNEPQPESSTIRPPDFVTNADDLTTRLMA